MKVIKINIVIGTIYHTSFFRRFDSELWCFYFMVLIEGFTHLFHFFDFPLQL